MINRAVALMSQPATLQFSSDNIGTLKSAPPLGIKPLTSLNSKNRSVSAVKREWNEANWKVSILEPVPLDFPLERTRREIHNVSATEVAERISKTLRLLSVEAEYDGQKGKAKCKTSDSVSFRIRLFAGDESLQQPVVVEIQRRSGSPSCFMRICRNVLDGAEGIEIHAETVPARKKMPPCMMKTPVGSLKCIQKANIPPRDPHAEAKTGINKSLELLRSKERDVNLLGLEGLCHATDPTKTRPDVALISCKAVIGGEYSVEIREEIGVMLQNDAFEPEDFGPGAMKDLFDKSRHLTLILVSNILELTSKDGCLVAAVETDKWFAEFLIPSLVDEIKSFESSSNNAHEAACGLTCLASCSEVARRLLKDMSAVEDLQSAHQFAIHNHELLAIETKQTLKALGHSI